MGTRYHIQLATAVLLLEYDMRKRAVRYSYIHILLSPLLNYIGRGTLIQETTYFLKAEISQFTQQNVSNVNWENQRRALVREKQKV